MRLPGLDDIRPRTAVLVGFLSTAVLLLTIASNPVKLLRIFSLLAAMGSFVLAFLNWFGENDTGREQSAKRTAGDHRLLSKWVM